LNPSTIFGALAVMVSIGIVSAGISSPDRMRDLFGETTYYILWLTFLIWFVQFGIFLRSIGFSWKGFLCESWPVFAVALLLTVMTAVAVPPKFRVLADEANLASVSRSMVHSKTAYNFTIGKYYYFTFHPVLAELDKRPLLYPFFAHFFHLVRGYEVRNLFLLNLSLLFLLLSSVGILVRRAFNAVEFPESGWAWISAVFLVLLCPIVTLTATSGGFDFFATVFFGWSFIVLAEFLKKPTSESFAFLWMNLILLSHTRYESILFFGIVIIGLALFRRIEPSLFSRFTHVYLVTPLAMVPLMFLRMISGGKFENPPGVPVFAVKHFFMNARRFFEAISDFTYFYPYPNLLLWLSLALLPVIGIRWFQKNRVTANGEARQLLLLLLACLCVYLVIVFSYFFGDPKHPASARFFLLPVGALALVPILAHRIWPRYFDQRLLLAGTVGMLLLYFPVASEDRFTQSLELIRETEHSLAFLDRMKTKNILVITDRPGIYTAFQYGATDFEYADKHKKELLAELRNNLYDGIIVLQHISYAERKPPSSEALDPEFVLEVPDAEFQITGGYFLRISHVAKPGNPTTGRNR
jgi:hypothetical protein